MAPVTSNRAVVYRSPAIGISPVRMTPRGLLQLIRPFAGWGMRITFMDESRIHEEPEVIVRDPDDEG